MTIRLECVGGGDIAADLLLGGKAVPNWSGASCGKPVFVMLLPKKQYVLKLSVASAGQTLAYSRYTLTIQNWP